MSDILTELFKCTPEQQRVFKAVSEFEDACNEMLLAGGASVSRDDVMRQMVCSSMLSVYGSTWVDDTERDAVAGAAMGVVKAFSDAKSRAWCEIQHEDHAEPDEDCDICIEIQERAEREKCR